MVAHHIAFIVALVIPAACQITQPDTNRASHFYWSEAKSQELDYKSTIASAKELSPKERNDLLAFVLYRFKHPVNAHDEEMFEGISDDQMRKLTAATRIELVDLDGDGKKEIIAQGNGIGPCGATGNCIVLVLRDTDTGWETLLDSRIGKFGGGYEKIRVLDTKNDGFRDIVLASHDSAAERTAIVYRYEEGHYVPHQCYHISWWTFTGGYHRVVS